MDTDIPGNEDWLPHILGAVQGMKHPPAILCTGIRPNPNVLSRLQHPAFTGYILKDEVSYSLAWAVDLALAGKWVITDSIRAMAFSLGIDLPDPCVIIDGRKTMQEHLTPHQADVARLAFLFSMGSWEYTPSTFVALRITCAFISIALKAAAVSVVK